MSEIVKTSKEVIQPDLLARDFDAIVRALKVFIVNRSFQNFTNFYKSEFGIEIVEVYAYLADAINWFLDFYSREAFITDARLDSSIKNLAELVGYRPYRYKSATVISEVTFDSDVGSVILPAFYPPGFWKKDLIDPGNAYPNGYGTSIETFIRIGLRNDLINLYLPQDVGIVPKSFIDDRGNIIYQASVEFSIGRRIVEIFSSTGHSNQRIFLKGIDGLNFVQDSIQVWVRNLAGDWEQWEEVKPTVLFAAPKLLTSTNNFLTPTATIREIAELEVPAKVFHVEYSNSDVPIVVFGDGLRTASPPAGLNNIQIVHTVGGGSFTNFPESTIDATGYAFNFIGDQIPYRITNKLNAATGGRDTEPISSIRFWAPRLANVSNIAITERDYVAYAEGFKSKIFGSIAMAKAKQSDLPYESNWINVYIWQSDGPDLKVPSIGIAEELHKFLDQLTIMGPEVRVIRGKLFPVDVDVEIKVDPSFNRFDVKGAVEIFIQNLFRSNRVRRSTHLRESWIWEGVHDTEGVVYCHVLDPLDDVEVPEDTSIILGSLIVRIIQ